MSALAHFAALDALRAGKSNAEALEAAREQARQWLVRLRIPSALPFFFGGLRISSGLALIGAVVGMMLATGTIDIGSAARALGQIAENRVGSKTDMVLKYASAMGMYTETFSRLTTALAARERAELSAGSVPGLPAGASK